MKTAIVYCSKHHENTKRLVDAIAEEYAITQIDALQNPEASLSDYDLIGFASGIYYGKFNRFVLQAAASMPKGRRVFFLYTCGAKKDGYTKAIAGAVLKRNAQILGEYGCLGYDTFGPFKLIGGIAKGHPNYDEIRGAVDFFAGLQA